MDMRMTKMAAADLGIIPPQVTEAEHTAEAAHELKRSIAAEAEPDLSGLTARNLAARHRQLVDAGNRDARLAAADKLVKAADAAVESAWWHGTHAMFPRFGEKFGAALADFTGALAQLDGSLDAARALNAGNGEAHKTAQIAGSTLSTLAAVRDEYASRSGGQADVGETGPLARLLSLVVLPNRETFRDVVRIEATVFSPPWFAEVIRRGLVLGWHSKSDVARLAEAMAAASRPDSHTTPPATPAGVR